MFGRTSFFYYPQTDSTQGLVVPYQLVGSVYVYGADCAFDRITYGWSTSGRVSFPAPYDVSFDVNVESGFVVNLKAAVALPTLKNGASLQNPHLMSPPILRGSGIVSSVYGFAPRSSLTRPQLDWLNFVWSRNTPDSLYQPS